MVDPGGDPAPLGSSSRGMGARTGGILVTHTDVDHIGGVAALADGTGAEVWAPAGEAEALRSGETRGGMRVPAARPGAHRVGRRRDHGRGHRVRGRRRSRPLGPATSPSSPTASSSPATCSSRARSAASTSPAATGRRCSPRSQRLLDRFGPDAVVYPGPRRADDARPRARDEPVPGRAARRALMAEKFQAPRGTHDVLPGRAAAVVARRRARWRSSRALYGYRPDPDARLRGHRRSSRAPPGEASDVVQKEMYTFTDRSDRSLTLRPEGTAPIARAYVEHGMHREPQPVKALHDRADVPLRARRRRGRYREHWQLSVEAIGSAGPGDRRRGDPALRRAAAARSASPSASCS